MSVRDNARFLQEIAKEHGGFGRFLANWPSSDEIGLLNLLAKRGSRLGGNTGQMLLRFLGWDGFVTSRDVTACLRDAGLDIAEEVKSKTDLLKVQAQFNAWAGETGLPYIHLSRICAMSIGENYDASELAAAPEAAIDSASCARRSQTQSSSLRKQGPITIDVCWRRGPQPSCQNVGRSDGLSRERRHGPITPRPAASRRGAATA